MLTERCSIFVKVCLPMLQFGAALALAQLAGRGTLTISSRKRGRPLVTSHINFSHCIADGSWRPNFLFGKMLGSSLFHILWTSRCSFSPCPYGIVVVVFHFDSGGRKAKLALGKVVGYQCQTNNGHNDDQGQL